jgi:2-polyprenyl-3-methyl-5-hydroxy-6-metoxy-1,4-benzoquinol methylase
MKRTPIRISEDLQSKLLQNLEPASWAVRRMSARTSLPFLYSEGYLESQVGYYTTVMEKLGIQIDRMKILEVGSGFGFFLCYVLKNYGWNICGIEPGSDIFDGRHDLASQLLEENALDKAHVIMTHAEKTDFADNSFDVILSNDVLEHVANPLQVLRESVRILRPGGLLIFNFPNYNWIYEGHYNVPWIPLINKPLARWYVRLLGRDAHFLEHLSFLTPRQVNRFIRSLEDIDQVLPLEYKTGEFIAERIQGYLEQKRDTKSLGYWMISALHLISRNPVFQKAFVLWARMTSCYHEMHFVIRKRGGSHHGEGRPIEPASAPSPI